MKTRKLFSRRAESLTPIMKLTTQPALSTIATMLLLTLGFAFAPIATAQTPPTDGFFNVLSFGALPDGQAKCTEAIGKAIDAASSKGGGTVYFPAGTYLTGPIHLRSHITLYVDAGAKVKFRPHFRHYLPMVLSRWEGIVVTNFSPLIYAYQASDIAIVGRGTLEGQGKAWWDFYNKLRRGGSTERNKWQEEFT